MNYTPAYSDPADFWLDPAQPRLIFQGKDILLSPKSYALIGMLTLERLKGRGWIRPEDMEHLGAWDSGCKSDSLRRQIRRVISRVVENGADCIEWKAKLKGPFRLALVPERNRSDIQRLTRVFGGEVQVQSADVKALEEWLRKAEKVLETDYSVDKSFSLEHVFDKSLDNDGAASSDSLMLAKWEIAMARRKREMGDFNAAFKALDRAIAHAKREPTKEVRELLLATCLLQRAWTFYRRKRFPSAADFAKQALHAAQQGGFIRLLGQVRVLNAILCRRDGNLNDAVRELQVAARYFLVEGDPYNFFSVFHHLGLIVAEQFNRASEDDPQSEELLRRAARLCDESARFCEKYHVGQNSALSEIKAAALTAQFDKIQGFRKARKALEKALKIKAYSDAGEALGLCLGLYLKGGKLVEETKVEATKLANECLRKLPVTVGDEIRQRYQARLDALAPRLLR